MVATLSYPATDTVELARTTSQPRVSAGAAQVGLLEAIPAVRMREHIRHDIVRAIQLNAHIDRVDPQGALGYPSRVYSQPVELEPWPS